MESLEIKRTDDSGRGSGVEDVMAEAVMLRGRQANK